MIFVILLLAFILRLILFPYLTHTSDMSLWLHWGNAITNLGFDDFFARVEWTDYLPFYFYVLWAVAKLAAATPLVPVTFWYKLPAILADVGAAFLIYKIVKRKSETLGITAAAFYAFNPAAIFNSTLWGQVDGIGAFLVLGSLYYFLEKRHILAGGFLGAALVFKPLFIVAIPLFAIALLRNKLVSLLKFFFGTGLLSWALAFPFVFSKSLSSPISFLINPVFLLWERYRVSISQYPYTSVNAFNFWSFGGRWWESDLKTFLGLSYYSWGAILVFAAIVLCAVFLIKAREKGTPVLFLSFFVLFLTVFAFATRAHERHMFTALPFLAMLAPFSVFYFTTYAVLSLSYVLNLHFALQWLLRGGEFVFGWGMINTLSLINTVIPAAFLVMFSLFLFGKKTSLPLFSFTGKGRVVFGKKELIFIVLTLLFLLRVARLGVPNELYFDEVYHAFTAQEYIKGNPQAWEFSATPPEGFAYEWTHPPLAKFFMAGGILVWDFLSLGGGENAVSWRFPGVIFGVLSVVLVYLLAQELFGKKPLSLLAAGLFALDGLPFVMSRIGMNDIYFLAFALLTLLLFLRNSHFLSALSFGAALATKWTAFFILPVLLVGWFLYRKKVTKKYLWYLLLPPAVYLLSYIPFFTSGHGLSQWWETQKQMWWYHTNLEATHPYSSPWFSWPFNETPVWLYTKDLGGMAANIYASGNPIIFWGGLAGIVISLVALRRKTKHGDALLFLLVGYLVFFLPWAFSPRIMFLYHYLPSVPFMVIILSWVLVRIWEKGLRVAVLTYAGLAVGAFILYYPLWTALPVPSWWVYFIR